jgi:tetratricopeptide (TPR) repeat protein
MSDKSHWDLLGIEATDDEEVIRTAYLAGLPNYHPEEDPDGFREFREAYEAALAEARAQNEAEEEEDNSESGLIVRELKAVIDDFVKRINPEAWRDVLERDECARIDLQAQIGEKLLLLLMEDYYLPQKIWRLLDEFFAWSSQADLLKENFHPNYIDYVLNSINFEENIRAKYFDLSDPDADFLGIVNKYYEISSAINGRDMEAALTAVTDAADKGFSHLDIRLQTAGYYYFNDENEIAEAKIGELLSEYPDDDRANSLAGQIVLQSGRPKEALEYFEKLLADNPSHYNARIGEAQAYFDMEDYETSKQKCLDMLTEDHYDGHIN